MKERERDEGSYGRSGRDEKGESTKRFERRRIESDAGGVEKKSHRERCGKIEWIKCRGVT